jgi:hypothetical protein
VRSAHLRSASEYWSQDLLKHDCNVDPDHDDIRRSLLGARLPCVNVFPARELVLLQQLMERQNDLCSAGDWRLLALGAGSKREDGHLARPLHQDAKIGSCYAFWRAYVRFYETVRRRLKRRSRRASPRESGV